MISETLGTNRLFSKFIILLLPLFAIVAIAAVWSIANNTLEHQKDEMSERVSAFAKQMSVTISAPEVKNNQALTESYLKLFNADKAIVCAEVVSPEGKTVASWPSKLGCHGSKVLPKFAFATNNGIGTFLQIGVSASEISTLLDSQRTYLLSILGIALVIATFASWLSFQFVVGRPLSKILEAVQLSQKTGSLTKVEVISDDELGTLAKAINALEEQVESEVQRNRKAVARIDHIYNETPAMMFAVNEEGSIISTSDYWLEVTGYGREEIRNQKILDFVSIESAPTLKDKMNFGITTKLFQDVQVQFRRKNGSYMEVMLSATRDDHDEQKSYLCVMTDVSEFKSAQRSLQQIATTDHLTQLPNRKGLFDYINTINQLPSNLREQTSFLFIDLDGFKAVNDTHGHDAGDSLLKMVAMRIRNNTKSKDFAARLSGDEFVIVLQSIKADADVSIIAMRLLEALSLPFTISNQEINIGASIGIANFSFGAKTAEDVLNMADKAMYYSKNQGKNRITNFRPELALLENPAQVLH
jgi:diguanylate cyclase (GGDEF)-like protein/PAS domain S-box-containing protein